MQLTLLILVVGASLCMAVDKNPGLVITLTDESQTLYHNDVDYRKLLDWKLNNSIIPHINRTFSTILWSKCFIDLKDMILKAHERPKFLVSIDSKEGMILNVSVPMMEFVGKHVVLFDNGFSDREWTGNFTLLMKNTMLKIRKEIVVEDENTVKWASTNMTGSIDFVEIHTGDVELDGMLAMIDSSDVIKAVIDCFGDAYKHLTEYEVDISYNITDDIHLDMSLVGQPVIFNGAIAFPHRAEAVFKGDDRRYELEPPKLDVVHPNATVLYKCNELPFNSLLWVAHNHKLLSHTFTKANLPDDSKHRLNTTCDKDCFGKLFPQAAVLFPDSSVELVMDTCSPPFVKIDWGLFKIWMEFNVSAKARKNAEPDLTCKDVFTVQLNVSASVQSSVNGTKIYLGLGRAESDVDIIDSKIGNLDLESVRDLCHMILEDKLATILVETKVEGKELKLNEPVDNYEIRTKDKYVNLWLNLKAKGNM